MEVTRISLKGWTASFRYPMFITGYQPTLTIPPLSTIYGLISAAAGKPIIPKDTELAFVFRYQAKSIDLETIYELAPNLKAKSNVIRREFLYEPELYLYIENEEIAECFSKPYFPLLLGRSSDLIEVKEIKKIVLSKVMGPVKFGKTIIPTLEMGVRGTVQALPTYFTQDIPRKAVDTKLYMLLDKLEIIENKRITWQDTEFNWGLYFHGANM